MWTSNYDEHGGLVWVGGLPVYGEAYVRWRDNTQQETRTMSSTGTLDGMTIAQLRELAERAEATAKQKEADEKARVEREAYVDLGVGSSGYERRIRKSDFQIQSKSRFGGGWSNTFEWLGDVVRGQIAVDLISASEILAAVAKLKKDGAL